MSARSKALASALEHARWAKHHSRFYRNWWGAADIPSFETLPILMKDRLVSAGLATGDLFTADLGGATGFNSGGSTGDPILSYYTRPEIERMVAALGYAYTKAGMQKGDKVGNLFVTGYLYASFLLVTQALMRLEITQYPLSHVVAPEGVAAYVEKLGINTIAGISSHVAEVLDVLLVQRKPLLAKVFYAGEGFPDAAIARYRDELGLHFVRSGGYGAVDTGLMGYQCEYAQGGDHHLMPGFYLEAVNWQSGRPVPEGEAGDILVTDLERKLAPLIRYRIGDRGLFFQQSCACGETGTMLRLLGRADDYVESGGKRLYYGEALHTITAHYPTLTTFQLQQGSSGLSASFECADPTAYEAKLIADIFEAMGFPGVAVNFVGKGTIPRHPKTGKLAKVLRQ